MTAQRTSFTEIGGDVFSDGNERKVGKTFFVAPHDTDQICWWHLYEQRSEEFGIYLVSPSRKVRRYKRAHVYDSTRRSRCLLSFLAGLVLVPSESRELGEVTHLPAVQSECSHISSSLVLILRSLDRIPPHCTSQTVGLEGRRRGSCAC